MRGKGKYEGRRGRVKWKDEGRETRRGEEGEGRQGGEEGGMVNKRARCILKQQVLFVL